MRMKASIFTIGCLAMALAACGQPVQEPGAMVENAQSESEPMNPSVRAALEVVPDARPYVDPQSGDFDYAAARSDLGRVLAAALRSEWNHALSDVRSNA